MAKDNYMSLYFDNLSRTASLLEGVMDSLDNDVVEDLLPTFERLRIEKKNSVDERAATIRSLETCQKELEEHRNKMNLKLQQVKKIKEKLKESTSETIQSFNNQPFRGDFCEIKTQKTRGSVELNVSVRNVSVANVIDQNDYAETDIPIDCLGKATYYYVDKAKLLDKLKNGLEIKDAKIRERRTIRIKDLA